MPGHEHACQFVVSPGRTCSLVCHPLPERFRLHAQPAQDVFCLLHRSDNRVSLVLGVIAERREPILAGTELRCAYCREVLLDPTRSICLLSLEEAIGLVVRYLDAIAQLDIAPTPVTDVQIADLVILRLMLSQVQGHLLREGIVEAVHVQSDSGQRTTTGRVSSFLREMRALEETIRQGEAQLLSVPSAGSKHGGDDRWLIVTDDRTDETSPA